MRSEPRLIRRPRPSQELALFLPTCRRCDKVLRGKQTMWCSDACRARGVYWAGQLRAYWEKAG